MKKPNTKGNDLWSLPKFNLKMKLFLLFLSITLFQVNASTYGQKTKISLNMEGVSLAEVIDEIEDNSEFRFLYSSAKTDLTRLVTVKVNKQQIHSILQILFNNTDTEYQVIDKQVILTKSVKKPKLSKIVLSDFKIVQHTIIGSVTDKDGTPLPGASIVEKGISNGTQSDFNGNFSLELANENATLVVSYIGFATKELPINGQTDISIVLQESTSGLDEVIVVGYGTQKKSSLTSAITTVDIEEIEGRSTANLTSTLQGITPGLYIRQASGRPGTDPVNIDIRGASRGTFSSNSALVIVDGIPSEFNSVNPDDIENISILKDAAAASIYGARGTGGVVLITTKKGKIGDLNINYKGQAGFQSSQILNNLDFLNTSEYMRFVNQAGFNDSEATGNPYNSVYSDSDITDAETEGGEFPTSSEWRDWIPKAIFMQNHNVNMSGGTEKLRYYSSLGFLEQDGLVPNDVFYRKSIQLNLDYKASEKLDIGIKLGYIKEDRNSPSHNADQSYYSALRTAILTDPTVPFRFSNGEYNHAAWASSGNPIYLLNNAGTREQDIDKFRGSINLNYEILPDLNIKAMAGGRVGYDSQNTLVKKLTMFNEDGSLYGNNTNFTSVSENFGKTVYLNTLLSLDYSKNFGDHALYGMVGYTTERNRFDFLTGASRNFLNNEIREIDGSIGGTDDTSVGGNAAEWALASAIGRVTYNYREKYFLETSFRYDGSSRISPSKRYGLFPAASASWIISREAFLENANFISHLKLRASWGKLGNQGGDLYPFSSSLNIRTNGYALGDNLVSTVTSGQPVDLNLRWEEKTSKNIGLDFGFLEQKLRGSFDYFIDQTDRILTRPTAPTPFGAVAPIQNAWSIENRGYEFAINWHDDLGEDFTYNIGFNISDTKDKVTKFTNGNAIPGLDVPAIRSGDTFIAEGHSQNELYGYKTNGLYVSQAEIDADGNLYDVRPGEIRYVDVNGDGVLDGDDRTPLGKSATPHNVYGINLGITFKQFDFSAILNGVGSRWGFRNSGGTYLLGYRPGPAILRSVAEDAWSIDNPNPNATWTRPTNDFGRLFGGFRPFGDASEYHMRNYSYIRLKNLQFGYSIPNSILERSDTGITRIRIYFTGENLFTIANGFDEPVDPEADQTFTSDARTYLSNLRNLSLGLSIGF